MMARDCGESTPKDIKRSNDAYREKLDAYKDSLKKVRDALDDTHSIWVTIWKL